ncbi:hypothetical protein B0H16DRAFT_1627410 [Mycena metata]|uniref:Extracellular serine-rich protein n=1 Tax=Mycena metata TaxID=1033252 RepID=A0AAD7H3X5_9AGAR|nr:hypothetical protein B0H16DRAFT_1627410 [Mycena metata]
MLAFTRLSLAAAVLAPALSTYAARILVQVGPGGQTIFSPSNVTASVGDVVSFQFLSKNHSVTQSSFASPCEPLAGGVDSGFQPVAVDATNLPEFSIAINNASKPLFFFSAQTALVDECNLGMVFSINQDANSATKSFADFQANAKADVPAAKATAVASSSTVAAAPAAASSGAKILVQVGAGNGLTFSPSNISANTGDTVSFQFLNGNHSVTQSSFASPCEPLAGGIDSGLQFVAANATAVPEFSFTITNGSKQFFFFSKQTVPANECNKGMVFSINQDPTSAVKSFAAFQANAKADIPASTATAVGTKATAVPAKASSGSEILVQVGADDSLTFSPSNISAKAGDTVTFQFLSKNHSVTQTTFAEPCSSPLFGGIDSGFQPIAPNATAIPQFSFTLNNANTPLFFFSKQGAECNQGMVFSINQNPNSAQSFAAFQANAEADIRPAAKVNKRGWRVHARDFSEVVGK